MAAQHDTAGTKARSPRGRDLLELGIGVAIVLLVLFIGSFFRVRVDLTSEKRHTLRDATREMLQGLDDVVFVRVFLAGELPADMRRLAMATRDLLDEMRVHNPDLLQYEVSDPNASPDERTREEVYTQLQKEGLQYSSIRIRSQGSFTERIIFPGALITYRGKTLPVQLLKTRYQVPDADIVNRSVNNLEYELASAIRQITATSKPRIAIMEGYGTLAELETKDIENALGELYDVRRVRLDEQVNSLSHKNPGMRHRVLDYEALIVPRPTEQVSQKDRYIIDQFIMNGGRVIWCIDAMNANLDSLRRNQMSIATPHEHGLDELLFSYGVRINKDLLLDASCAPIEIYTTPFGNQRKLERFNWYFEPVLIPNSAHPIVANIDPVHTRFVSSMDTLGTDSVRKTVLLTTSPYTRLLRNPVRVALNVVELDLGLERSTTPSLPVAVLLEGTFRSAYADRISPLMRQEDEMAFREWSRPTAQLVVSDGDVMANRVDPEQGMYYMLGYDRYARSKIYGNREFLVNAMNYLLDDRSLISIRSREITLRQLDPKRIVEERLPLQVLNVALPILITILAGIGFHLVRVRRNARKT